SNTKWFYGVMVSTLDSESSDPSSNLGGTFASFYILESLNNKLTILKPTNRSQVLFHGVMVSTLDFESSDPSSNLGGT
ncbi:hypothetical protein WN51_13847, partial [Melipona quadrifasciata]